MTASDQNLTFSNTVVRLFHISTKSSATPRPFSCAIRYIMLANLSFATHEEDVGFYTTIGRKHLNVQCKLCTYDHPDIFKL